MNNASVTKATLGRLPMYLQYLKGLNLDDYPTISATIIAKEMGLGEVQVRKDLGSISGKGRPKVGYITVELMAQIEAYLSPAEFTNAVIAGAGKLGRALLGFDGFADFGLSIVAAFDTDEAKVGTTKSGKQIYSMNGLKKFCEMNKVRIGILTVPHEAAQETCDALVASGIKAIWNFTMQNLNVPEGVVVRQENLALSLAYLNEQIRKI